MKKKFYRFRMTVRGCKMEGCGASVISRVMGIILAAVAMQNCLAGIREYFQF